MSVKTILHFLHIGKTGGSAIKTALKDHLETEKYLLKLHDHSTSLKDILVGEQVVFFLREPVSRFVSGFYSRQRKGKPRYNSRWTELESKVFAAFETPNQLACALADKANIHHALALEALNGIDHLRHYDKWYIDWEYFNSRITDVFFVGYQENLDHDFAKLLMMLGYEAEIKLPSDDITAHRNPATIDKEIDEPGLTALQNWYVEDVNFIVFCQNKINSKDIL